MLRAIVCRIRDIFSMRTPPKSSVSGEPGGVTPRGMRGGDLLVRFADVGADVFGRDAAAGAGGRTRRRSTPSWRARRRTAGPAAADGVTVAGHIVDVVIGRWRPSWLWLSSRRRGLGSSSSSLRARASWRFLGGALAAAFFFAAVLVRIGFFGRFFGFLRLGLLSALAALRPFLLWALPALSSAVFASAPAASISMIGAPTSTVSPSPTRILVILPACGLGIGIVALSVSTSSRS